MSFAAKKFNIMARAFDDLEKCLVFELTGMYSGFSSVD